MSQLLQGGDRSVDRDFCFPDGSVVSASAGGFLFFDVHSGRSTWIPTERLRPAAAFCCSVGGAAFVDFLVHWGWSESGLYSTEASSEAPTLRNPHGP